MNGQNRNEMFSPRHRRKVLLLTTIVGLVFGVIVVSLRLRFPPSTVASQLYDHAARRGIQIAEINASPANYLDATLAGGTHVRISWRDMGKGTERSFQDLDARLDMLAILLKDHQAKKNPVRIIDFSDSRADHSFHPATQDSVAQEERATPDDHPQFASYMVNENDNLLTIAEMFGTSVEELEKANTLKNGHIVPGQEILIPITSKTGVGDGR